ncbi:MarR family winged helix-turn-helix transcriptional regulator [Sutterella sp.]|uniref:MarR family winged helix-turn-helix transcriptional regulator n=1 Tax=Sutterella sp. TaxID=1981025 RepID=UPI0026DEACBA|nr:MarR family transcriptional regulator [Sutterella sp.]MDO5532429.1 MarR family transcriptional regulator [Sutterella sp.]
MRLLPARENLRRVHGAGATDLDVSGIDMMLHLINAVDIIRATIYESLRKETGLSEGKFTLMMALRDANRPLSIGTISAQLGVAPATISVMVGRMLREDRPLISTSTSDRDARSTLVRLSPAGKRLLDKSLPAHYRRIAEFTEGVNQDEREQLIALIRKLVRRPEADPQD